MRYVTIVIIGVSLGFFCHPLWVALAIIAIHVEFMRDKNENQQQRPRN